MEIFFSWRFAHFNLDVNSIKMGKLAFGNSPSYVQGVASIIVYLPIDMQHGEVP